MYSRMTSASPWKCIASHYKETELSKDRIHVPGPVCLQVPGHHDRMGKKLTELSMQDEELLKRVQQSSGPCECQAVLGAAHAPHLANKSTPAPRWVSPEDCRPGLLLESRATEYDGTLSQAGKVFHMACGG